MDADFIKMVARIRHELFLHADAAQDQEQLLLLITFMGNHFSSLLLGIRAVMQLEVPQAELGAEKVLSELVGLDVSLSRKILKHNNWLFNVPKAREVTNAFRQVFGDVADEGSDTEFVAKLFDMCVLKRRTLGDDQYGREDVHIRRGLIFGFPEYSTYMFPHYLAGYLKTNMYLVQGPEHCDGWTVADIRLFCRLTGPAHDLSNEEREVLLWKLDTEAETIGLSPLEVYSLVNFTSEKVAGLDFVGIPPLTPEAEKQAHNNMYVQATKAVWIRFQAESKLLGTPFWKLEFPDKCELLKIWEEDLT